MNFDVQHMMSQCKMSNSGFNLCIIFVTYGSTLPSSDTESDGLTDKAFMSFNQHLGSEIKAYFLKAPSSKYWRGDFSD